MYKLLKELLEGMKQEEKIVLLAAIGSRNKEIQEQLQEKQQDKRITKDVKEAAAAAIKEQLQRIFERK